MDGPSIITNIVFGFTGLWLLFRLIQRLATVEEELIDAQYALKDARRSSEVLNLMVKMQRESAAAAAAEAAAVEPTAPAVEPEEGEVLEGAQQQVQQRGRTRHR